MADLRDQLADGLRSGTPLVLGTTRPDVDETDPARLLPADVLRSVLCDRELHKQADPRGLTVRGAVITGVVDLDHVTIPYPLALTDCQFSAHLRLRQASLHALALNRTTIAGRSDNGDSLAAEGLQAAGGASLDNGFTAAGAIRLLGARINGQLSLGGATITGSRQRRRQPRCRPAAGER